MIQCYKSRLLPEGFSQKYEKDYDETFTSIVKPTAIRTLLRVIASKRMNIVNIAFLHGELQEEIYMQQAPSFIEKDKEGLCVSFRKLIRYVKCCCQRHEKAN